MDKRSKPHILILSDPPAAPGFLPRLRYICEYLQRNGYEIKVVTEQYQPLAFAYNYPILTIPMYSGSNIDWATKTLWTLLTDWHNRVFAKHVIQHIGSYRPQYILCTAFSDFPLGAAQRIAAYYNAPLLCDIRDLDEQVEGSCYAHKHQAWWTKPFRQWYRKVHIRRRNKVLKQANTITTVSPWHADFIRTFNSNTHIVYNGYDPKQFYPGIEKTETFRISYIGSLFKWQQEALEKVKRAIQELNNPHIVLDIHTPQSNPIPHDQLGHAIRRSSIMLVLTSPNTHGMLTTKFYEALGCAKPILCVPSDKGALATLIQYTHAGVATDDIEQIKAFILSKYQEWQTTGYTLQQTEHREEFSRETQCNKLAQLISI